MCFSWWWCCEIWSLDSSNMPILKTALLFSTNPTNFFGSILNGHECMDVFWEMSTYVESLYFLKPPTSMADTVPLLHSGLWYHRNGWLTNEEHRYHRCITIHWDSSCSTCRCVIFFLKAIASSIPFNSHFLPLVEIPQKPRVRWKDAGVQRMHSTTMIWVKGWWVERNTLELPT